MMLFTACVSLILMASLVVISVKIKSLILLLFACFMMMISWILLEVALPTDFVANWLIRVFG